ncbi:PA14 domain-containing protein [Archangium lipolyticum]|uniref:PA14 domain-containing protein n=1 Tax=Archangium lipolyticum TaxID=2970465 RepID=UPI00214A2379|nr:PA14 domain-containing protein [Archangium lipolyticum]
MNKHWSRLAAALALSALAVVGCTSAEEPRPEPQPEQARSNDVGQMFSRLTAQELDVYAQRGLNFVVPDTVTWTKTNGCGACHRVGAPLYGASLAAYTGYQVNTSQTTGTGYLASFLSTEQLANGSWTHSGSYTYIKTAYNAFGLAGYSQYDSDVYLPKLQKAVDWAMGATAGYKFTNPVDGKALQGVTSAYMPQDHGSNPVTLGWQMPTAYMAVATRALLDVGSGIPPLQRDNYSLFLKNMADSLEGRYVRSAGAWLPQDVAFAAIGTVQDGRNPANNASVAAMRDELLSRYSGGGWGDVSIGSPNVYTTGIALYALCQLQVRQDENATVANALTWLANQQCTSANNYCGTGSAAKNGSWVLTGHEGDVPTIFATLAMSCYGSLNVDVTLTPPSVVLEPLLAVPQTTSFTVRVRNTGYTRNTYTLVPSGNWPGMVVSHNNPSLTLEPGQEAVDVVTVTMPANLPESSVIPVSIKVSYGTRSGMVEKTVTFSVIVPPRPTVNGLETITTILSPANGAVIAPGTSVGLSARVRLAASGNAVTLGTMTFFSSGTAIATVQADASGNFSYNWPVPGSAPLGPQSFTATYNGYATANHSIDYKGSKADGNFTIGYANGFFCTTSAQCQSGFCVDGVCCNSACGDGSPNDCQACSRLAGAASDGVCGAVNAGTICRPSRGFCDVAETCDGVSTVCTATDTLAANGTSCGLNSASCSNGDCKTIPKGLNARYFNNTTVSEPYVYNRVETSVNWSWGTNAPYPGVNADNFSSRYTGDITTPFDTNFPDKYTGRYWFYTQSDEGVRLWVNGKLIIDNWTSHASTLDSGTIFLEAGKRYSVLLEYYEGTGNANVSLQWQPPTQATASVITSSSMTPAVNNPVPIRIRSPLDQTTYLAPANVMVDVEVQGLYATINKVEVFVDGVSQGAKTSAPFAWPVPLGAGVYTVTARVEATGTSASGAVPLVQYARPASVRVLPSPAGTSVGYGLTADYFNGSNFQKFEFTRSEYTLFLDGNQNNPLPQDILNPDGYSVRWTGTTIPAYSQAYTFSINANHPARVWVNNNLVIDTQANPGQTASAPIGLTAGALVPVKVEYYKNSATPTLMQLFWASQSEPKSLIPGTRLYPAPVSTRP